jgi:5-methylcytosine-specific restriction protein A
MNWIIPANREIYDCDGAFQKWGFIDWNQKKIKFQVGDVVYIYCTKPLMRVMYKTIVVKESLSYSQIQDDTEFWRIKQDDYKAISSKYIRLKLVYQTNSEKLSLKCLREKGLESKIRGPMKISDIIADYIDRNMDEYDSNNFFPDSDNMDKCYEGATHQVLVNRYERSSIARQRCIEYNGHCCIVCGIDFEKVYGEIGKGFIHIHHIVPLNEIGEEYEVDYKKDLIPVCPNCHAMLHRKINGEYPSWKELKDMIQKKV